MKNKIYSGNKISLGGLPENCFSANGLKVERPNEVVQFAGFGTVLPTVNASLPAIINNGVQTAATGIIQDPAGSAIGTGQHPSGGGASGAIYNRFRDLEPIPDIPMGASVFNSSTGEGHRVLHTYSPHLGSLSKAKPVDRIKVLESLSNAYINALLACKDALTSSDNLNFGAPLINLVPISAAIFAGNFTNTYKDKYGNTIHHLDPSYTLTAIKLALGYLFQKQIAVLPLSLYYFEEVVYDEAKRLAALSSA